MGVFPMNKQDLVSNVAEAADISKAKKLLGWEPKINQVDGITAYYKDNK